jgi:hypothetical protein
MSNDSREAFEKAIVEDGYPAPIKSRFGGYLFEDDVNRYAGWQAAQSRHEAEREALESSLAVTQAMLQDNEQAVEMLKEEREALVKAAETAIKEAVNETQRRCFAIVRQFRFENNEARICAIHTGTIIDEALALLSDSGSQG